MHLAPWSTLNKLKAYHGDLLLDQQLDMLDDEKPGSYIMSNYRPDKIGKEFTITRVSEEMLGMITSSQKMSFHIPDEYHVFHSLQPESELRDHTNARCDFPRIFKYPINRKGPHSLKSLARATICDTKTYQEIASLAEIGEITQDCKEFIMEKASPHHLTSRKMIFCECY